jgi:hypothetical protein
MDETLRSHIDRIRPSHIGGTPQAIAEEVGREVDYRDVEIDRAATAAGHIATLLN